MAFTKIVGAGIHTLSNVHTHNINSSGIITATQFVGIFTGTDGNFSGNLDVGGNVSIGGSLTVNGDFTTLNTTLREVEILNVDANSSATAGIITQRGTGDIFSAYDTNTEVFKIADGGVTTITKGASGGASANTHAPLILHNNNNNYIQILSPNNKEQGLLFGDDADNDAGNIIYDHSDNALTFATNGGTNERLRIDSSGRVLIGTDANRTTNSHTPALQISGDNYSESTVQIINNANASHGAYLFMGKQRSGSPGGNTIAANGDIVGQIRFSYADGTDMENQCAQIQATVDGVPGSNDTPGRLSFYTTPDNSTVLTERLRIDNQGDIFIGTTSDIAPVNGTNLCVSDATIARLILEKQSTRKFEIGAQDFINIYDHTADAERFRIDNTGKATFTTPGGDDALLVKGDTYTSVRIQSARDSDSDHAMFQMLGSRGTNASPSIIQSDDTLGTLSARGYDGNSYASSSNINFEVDGTPGDGDMPGRITFSTAADGSESPTEKLRITKTGKVGIGTINPSKTLTIFGASSSSFRISKSGVLAYDHTFDGSTYTIANNNGSAGIPIVIGTKTAGGESVRILSDGDVGIGTDTVHNNARLQVSTHQQVVAMFEGTGVSDPQIYVGDNMASPTDNCIILGYDKGDNRGYLTVGGDADDVFTIANGGSIGINNNNPQRRLHIGQSGTSEANIRIQGGSDYGEIRVKDSDNELSFHHNVGGAGSRELFSANGSTGHFSINCYSYQALTITTNENGTNGPEIQLMHNTASPAANDIIGQLRFSGKDSAGNTEIYSKIETKVDDPTSGSETGHLNFATKGLGSFANVFRIKRRSTASAPSYTADDADGIILDIYNTGNPYPRYMNFIAKSAGNTDSNIGFWTESVGGSPTERLRITSGGESQIMVNGSGGVSSQQGVLRFYRTGYSGDMKDSRIVFDTSAGTNNTDNATYCSVIAGKRTSSNNGSSDLRFYTCSNANSYAVAERLRITELGKVGINDDDPPHLLNVKDATNTTFPIIGIECSWTNSGGFTGGDGVGSGGYGELRLGYVDNYHRSIRGSYNLGLSFFTNNQEALRLNTSGTELTMFRAGSTFRGRAYGSNNFEIRGTGSNDNLEIVANANQENVSDADIVFKSSINGGTLHEKLRIKNDGAFYIKSPNSSTGDQPGEIQWWNENGAGVMAKIVAHREGGTYAPSGLKFYTTQNVDTSANNSQGDITERFFINSEGKFYKGGHQFYPCVQIYEARISGAVSNSTTGSYQDIKTVATYTPKKVGNRVHVQVICQTWHASQTDDSADVYARLTHNNGGSIDVFTECDRVQGNFAMDERYHHLPFIMDGWFTTTTTNSTTIKLQGNQAASHAVAFNWFHAYGGRVTIMEYDIT